jgi:protein subunit release factor B
MDPSPVELRRAQARRALALDDDALFAECTVDYYVASGPGGQHRNKTESGVRLTHPATDVTVTATERRSQPLNRGIALERLRGRLEALSFVPKPRRPTKVSRGVRERRLATKRRTSDTKRLRRQRPSDD